MPEERTVCLKLILNACQCCFHSENLGKLSDTERHGPDNTFDRALISFAENFLVLINKRLFNRPFENILQIRLWHAGYARDGSNIPAKATVACKDTSSDPLKHNKPRLSPDTGWGCFGCHIFDPTSQKEGVIIQ
ncbi:unnamed protein product [Clonostachys chloroleuca]|uniref:Uncharacterized protein n=1 Tax=Clonostachys chloroleuca TaxID=1926264 RepID=A0AA35MA95_9HYPO|nr:unnamed protein product [Clonostachys chloroleuca]